MIIKKNIYRLNDVEKLDCSDVVIINLPIYKKDILEPFNNSSQNLNSLSTLQKILEKITNSLNENGVCYIFGTPLQLIKSFEIVKEKLTFRHWIAIDVLDSLELQKTNHLKHNHIGALLLTKGNYSLINPSNARIPYIGCSVCGKNIKDWGGKKHLMNNQGTGISDVWRDFLKVVNKIHDPDNQLINLNIIDSAQLSFDLQDDVLPEEILVRMISLIDNKDAKITLYNISRKTIKSINCKKSFIEKGNFEKTNSDNIIVNKVLLGDCIDVMSKLSNKYPEGIFDLVFADPPYNLSKNYKEYDDSLAHKEYVEWCNRWLELCVKLTKPSGNILILNIPKWALEHVQALNKYAFFQNWIVWDSLSTPKGKIMPAHYALLYYTKSPNDFIFNSPGFGSSQEYCLRNSCITSRKKNHYTLFSEEINIKQQPISDIWSDVHRIKHKKDRDDHPCQLPDKLMDRIIEIFSNEGSLVFDPFSGAGTTALRAKKLLRNYLTIELDPYYKEITEKKLAQVDKIGRIQRQTIIKKKKSIYTKKELELKSQKLAQELGRKPDMNEFIEKYELDYSQIELLYDDPKRILKAGRMGIINTFDSGS